MSRISSIRFIPDGSLSAHQASRSVCAPRPSELTARQLEAQSKKNDAAARPPDKKTATPAKTYRTELKKYREAESLNQRGQLSNDMLELQRESTTIAYEKKRHDELVGLKIADKNIWLNLHKDKLSLCAGQAPNDVTNTLGNIGHRISVAYNHLVGDNDLIRKCKGLIDAAMQLRRDNRLSVATGGHVHLPKPTSRLAQAESDATRKA